MAVRPGTPVQTRLGGPANGLYGADNRARLDGYGESSAMRMTELEPQFLRRIDDTHFQFVDTIAEAQGIEFVCPKCLAANGGKRPGVHAIICWNPTVPQSTHPVPGRWEMLGTGFEDLTLRAGSSSVLLTGEGCKAHFFVEAGAIKMC